LKLHHAPVKVQWSGESIWKTCNEGLEITIMKKIIALLLFLLLLPASVALADNTYLGDTTWELEILYLIEDEEIFGREYIEENDLMITFRFEENGEVILSGPGGIIRGNYLLSGDHLEMDFQDDGNIRTTITEDDYGNLLFIFVNVFVDGQAHFFYLTEGTFGGSSPSDPDPAPATPAPAPEPAAPTPQPQQPATPRPAAPAPAPSDSGMPRILRDALWGGVIGAVAGGVVWLLRRKKKKSAETTPPGANPVDPAYYPTPAPMASAPMTIAPIGNVQRQLYCTSGPMAGATFPVNGSLRIGRDPNQCQIIFPADTAGVSALHCEVQLQPYGLLLIDHNSSHGTFLLNERKLHPNESVALNPGDGFYLAENRNSFKVL
jgi:hypothetical protein